MGLLTEVLALFEIDSPHRTNAFSTLLAISSALVYFIIFHPYKQKVNVPFVGVKSTSFLNLFLARFKFVVGAQEMLSDGYKKYRNQTFQVPTYSNNRVMLSAKHVEELRNAPESKLSLSVASAEFLQGKLCGLKEVLEEEYAPHMKVCKKELTQNLAKLVDPIMDEARFAFAAEFPEADDWTPVVINGVTLRLVARISGRVFVGLPFCRNEEWLETSVKFTEDLIANAFLVTLLPNFVRPFVSAYILPYARRVAHHREVARRYLAPVYAERIAQEKSGSEEKPIEDIYTWMLNNSTTKPHIRTPESLADFSLILSMTALHSTNITVVAILYELAARPEYIEGLREEMISVIEEDGGVLKKSGLAKMMKLDSFMKESSRFNSALVAFMRVALKPLDLSDGVHIPAGTAIGSPIRAMMHDPEIIENPEEFDGYRWYRMRQQEDQLKWHQFVSTNSSTLLFGHGNHACPGRFFAANEIQVMIVSIVLRYDFKYPEGETRPKNWDMGESVMQDTKRALLFKKRSNPPNFSFL